MKGDRIALQTVDAFRDVEPHRATCFAKGSVFERVGDDEFRVDTQARASVHRSLCVVAFYKDKCGLCPNGRGSHPLKLVALGPE